MKMKYFGIDLGTTSSEVGCYIIGSSSIKSTVKTLQIRQLEEEDRYVNLKYIPSVIYFKETQSYFIGKWANNMRFYQPERVVYNSKLHIGSASILNCNKTAKECATLILKECKMAIIDEIGREEFHSLKQIVVTVPASFDTFKSEETLEAAKMVFKDKKVSILDEPTAVLIYYINNQMNLDEYDFTGKKRILIYDIGGGTCDTCITDIIDGDVNKKLNFIITGRFSEFGGNDFDDRIAKRILESFLRQKGIRVDSIGDIEIQKMIRKIIPYASSLKLGYSEAYSKDEEFKDTVQIANFFQGQPLVVNVTEGMIEESLDNLLRKNNRDSRKNIFNDMDYALKELKKKIENGSAEDRAVDYILLAGGTSSFPIIKEAFEKEYQIPVIRIDRPTDAVAMGAAIFSYLSEQHNTDDENKEDLNVADANLWKNRVGFGSKYMLDVDGSILNEVIDSQVTIPYKTEIQYKTNSIKGIYINILYGSSRYDCKLKYISSYSFEFEDYFNKVIPIGTEVTLIFTLDVSRMLYIHVKFGNESAIKLLNVPYYGEENA